MSGWTVVYVIAGEMIHLISFNQLLGGGFKHFLFSPLFGEDSQFD